MATSTITNTITALNGSTGVEGVPVVVRLMPAGGYVTSSGAELAREWRTVTDASGVWSLALTRNSDITPSGTYYEVTEQIPRAYGGPRKHNIQVGSSNQTLYAALISTPSNIPTAAYLTQAAADARYVLAPGSFGGAGSLVTVTPGATANAGVLSEYARIDHRHPVTQGFQTCTSATRPSSPTKGDVIYETDTGKILVYYGATTGWQRVWGDPWGIITYDQLTADVAGIGTGGSTVLTGTAFTAVANRRYRVSAKLRLTTSSAAINAFVTLLEVSGATSLDITGDSLSAASQQVMVRPEYVGTFSAGSRQMRLSVATSAGTITAAAGSTFPTFISVEDIGPLSSTVPAA